MSQAKAVAEAVKEIEALRDRYRRRAGLNSAMFRVCGTLVVCLSAVVPLLAGLDFEGEDLTIGIVGVIVAIAAGLQSFFRWDRLWGLTRRIDFDLSHLVTQWELDAALIEERGGGDATARLVERTLILVNEADQRRQLETDEYFAKLNFPQHQDDGGGREGSEPAKKKGPATAPSAARKDAPGAPGATKGAGRDEPQADPDEPR